jgi:hypothetical protein
MVLLLGCYRVDFWTSDEENCETWSVLVWKDPDLPYPDGRDTEFGDFLAGHRVQNSIFIRHLNNFLACSVAFGTVRALLLFGLPGRMNGSESLMCILECLFVEFRGGHSA